MKRIYLLFQILLLFLFTGCTGIILSSLTSPISTKQTKQMKSAMVEYLKSNSLPNEYILNASRYELGKEQIDVKSTKSSKEFLVQKLIGDNLQTSNDSTDFETAYYDAKYFDGNTLYVYEGETHNLTTSTAQWSDFNFDNLPNVIRSNIYTIVSNVKVSEIKAFKVNIDQTEGLVYSLELTYDEKQINELNVFDNEVSGFCVRVMENKESTKFSNFTIQFNYNSLDYLITYGEEDTSTATQISLKEKFDNLIA